jgi:prepilin-type N-terminal cleavage/methylation domain-containing protein
MTRFIPCLRPIKGDYQAGFTLIELLIVVAIIAILAAIAVPNFLEAQTRSRVSRAKADMRSIGTGLEAYSIDHNAYPYYPFSRRGTGNAVPSAEDKATGFVGLTPPGLTTPVAYMTSLPRDAWEFGKNAYAGENPNNIIPNPMNLYNFDWHKSMDSIYGSGYWETYVATSLKWTLVSIGPDRAMIINNQYGVHNNLAEYYIGNINGAKGSDWHYDPSNGTVSLGDIVYSGPGGPFGYINCSPFKPI